MAALGQVGVGLLLLALAARSACAQTRLADGVFTRFTITPNQPAVFTYVPPTIGDKSVPFEAIDDTSRWIRVNAHAQRTQLTVTVALPPKPSKTMSGLDVGIIQRLGAWTGDAECLGPTDTWAPQPPEQATITISVANCTGPVNAAVLVAAFTTRPPVPGGCCTTCELDDDPSVTLSVSAGTLTAAFQQADLGVGRVDGTAPAAHACSCDFVVAAADTTTPALSYTLYRGFGSTCGSSFHPDLSEETYFAALARMSTVAGVRANGAVHSAFGAKETKVAHLTLRPGQVVVYNVLVTDQFQSNRDPSAAAAYRAVYTPRVTYGCSLDGAGPLPSCTDLGDAASTAMSVAAAIVGLYLALTGHRWIVGELAGFGLLMFGVGTHLALGVLLPDLAYKVHTALTGLGGLAGAAAMLVLWRLLHWSSLCTILIGLCCGGLTACVVFASPVGEYSLWQTPLTYAMCFACVTALVPVLLLLLRHRWLSRVSSSLVGTYCLLAGIDYFVGSSFSFMVLNVFNRVTVPGFAAAMSGNYFGDDYNGCTDGTKNMIMFIAWLASAVVCLIFQALVACPMDFPSSREPLWGGDAPLREQALQPLIERVPRRTYRTFKSEVSVQYAPEPDEA